MKRRCNIAYAQAAGIARRHARAQLARLMALPFNRHKKPAYYARTVLRSYRAVLIFNLNTIGM